MSSKTDTAALTRDAGEALLIHRMVRINSSNAYVYADAGEMPIGPVQTAIDSGVPVSAEILRNKPGTSKCVMAGACDQFALLYTAADGKVNDVNTGVLVGMALEAASGDGSIIEFLPCLKRVPYVNVAASAVLVATATSALPFDVTYTVPVSELRAGTILRIKASGIVVDQNSTDTLIVSLVLGTETIIATATVQVADNDQFLLQADVVVRSVGATGKLIALGSSVLDAAATAIGVDNVAAEATEDTTGGLAVTITGTWSAIHADNEARLDILSVELLNAD